VLVVPRDLTGIGVERQRRVVIEMRLVGAAEHELRRRGGHRRPHIDEVQRRVVARHHPGADMLPLFEGHAAPGLVTGFARCRNRAPSPDLGAGACVVRGDDARVRGRVRSAAASRDHLAAGDDRACRLQRGVHRVVEDLRFPDDVAGGDVQRLDVVVAGRVEDEIGVDGDVALGGDQSTEVVPEVIRQVATMLPFEIAGHGVDRLDDVPRVRHVEDTVVGQRRPLLVPSP